MDRKTLAAYILQALAIAQREDQSLDLDSLVDLLHVRRKDIRSTLTLLHQQGMLDVIRMRLSLQGFAMGSALIGEPLPALRVTPQVAFVAA